MTTLTARNYRAKDTITLGKKVIKQYDVTLTESGFEFFVDSELDAYQAAYVYRNNETRVIFAEGVQRWMVIVEKN